MAWFAERVIPTATQSAVPTESPSEHPSLTEQSWAMSSAHHSASALAAQTGLRQAQTRTRSLGMTTACRSDGQSAAATADPMVLLQGARSERSTDNS